MKKITLIILSLIFYTAMHSQEGFAYKVKNLDGVNSELSDFGTSFYGDKIVFASSKNMYRSNNKKWQGNNQPFLELYVGDINEQGEIVNEKLFQKSVNTKYHESNAIFTKDLKTVYFSRNNYINNVYTPDSRGINLIQLYIAKVNKKGKWTHIKPMPFNSKEYETGHPALSPDETKLYFISDMPGSIGKTDIWFVDILGNGKYGDPVNLGAPINSMAKEMFPYISESGNLYFSSNRSEGGFGGLDIYKSIIEGDTFSTPTILKAPLNSPSDDFSFIISEATETGYFSSKRLGGKGDDDIYYFERTEEDCFQMAEGIVRDKNSRKIIPGATVILFNAEGDEIERQLVSFDAKFSFKIDCKSNYKVVGSKTNYSEDSKDFVSNANLELGLDLSLNENPFVNQTTGIVNYDKCQGALDLINNIYFDLDESYIRPDAASELDKVIRIMKRCKGIQVEASSHTDTRAPRDYNQRLSQRRAQSTMNYIMRRGGFGSDRIRAVGYGEDQLKNKCSDGVRCTEAEHQVNRRSEFKIKHW